MFNKNCFIICVIAGLLLGCSKGPAPTESQESGQTTVPVTPSAPLSAEDKLWAEGKLPCDATGAKAKIILAMDDHSTNSQCREDEKRELKAAREGSAYAVREGLPAGFYLSENEVGSENHSLYLVYPLVVALFQAREEIRRGHPTFEQFDTEHKIHVAVLQLAFWVHHQKVKSQKPLLQMLENWGSSPEFLDLLPKFLKSDRDGDSDIRKQFGEVMFTFEGEHLKTKPGLALDAGQWVAKMSAFEPVLSEGLRELASNLHAMSIEGVDTRLLFDLADGKLSAPEEINKVVNDLMSKLSKVRDASIERSIADVFCKVSASDKIIYARFGIFHVPRLYASLKGRIEHSGGDESLLRTDARVLDYRGVREELSTKFPSQYSVIEALINQEKTDP